MSNQHDVVLPLGTTLREAERAVLAKALAVYVEKKKAARVLGISRSALYAKMRRHKIADVAPSAHEAASAPAPEKE